MSKGRKIALVAGGIILALLVAGIAVTGFALAQDPDPDQPANGAFTGRPFGHRGRWKEGGPGPMFGMPEEMKEAVAEAFGMTVEELEEALAEGQTLLQIAEQQGVDPAEIEADMEAARREHFGAMMEQGPPAGWMLQYHDEMEQAMADALNISVDELEAARAEGQHPFEIAQEQGLDLDQVHQALEAAREEIIEQAVADGILTEEQAEQLNEAGWGFGGGCGPGRASGRGGMRGAFGDRGGMPQRGFPFGQGQ